MRWYNKWIVNRANKIRESDREVAISIKESEAKMLNSPRTNQLGGIHSHSSGTSRFRMQGTTFVMWKADGGHVLEMCDYDPVSDRVNNSLHIIHSDKDLGEAIGSILTLQALKR